MLRYLRLPERATVPHTGEVVRPLAAVPGTRLVAHPGAAGPTQGVRIETEAGAHTGARPRLWPASASGGDGLGERGALLSVLAGALDQGAKDPPHSHAGPMRAATARQRSCPR